MIKCYASSWQPNKQCLRALKLITEILHSSFYDILTFAGVCQLTQVKITQKASHGLQKGGLVSCFYIAIISYWRCFFSSKRGTAQYIYIREHNDQAPGYIVYSSPVTHACRGDMRARAHAKKILQASVVQKMDSAIHRINL